MSIKPGGRHLTLRRLFKSTSVDAAVLVCIWELNVLYYGYIENFLKLTSKENHPCSICQRTGRKKVMTIFRPFQCRFVKKQKGRRGVQVCTRRKEEHLSHQTEHFGSGNAPSHLVFGTKMENTLNCSVTIPNCRDEPSLRLS